MDPEEHEEEREYTREDYEADQADIKIKEMKIDGTYEAWRNSHLSYGEFQRREAENDYERARAAAATFVRALDALREAVDACDRYPEDSREGRMVARVHAALADFDAAGVPCQEPERSALVDGGGC